MAWTWYRDGAPITQHDLGELQTAESTTLTVELWWHRDNPGAEPAEDVMLQASTEDPTRPGVYLRSGLPPQDQLWWWARVVGSIGATSDFRTDWTAIGAYRALSIPIFEAGTARLIELRCTPPGGADASLYQTRLFTAADAHAVPIPPSHTRGMLSGVGDPSVSGLVAGAEITTSEPADDSIHISPGLFVLSGRAATRRGGSVVFSDEDGAGQVLNGGESYWAALSQGAGAEITVTKGGKAVDPIRPPLPDGEVFLRWIRVEKVDGSIQIDPADLDGDPTAVRHPIRAGGGLEIHIGPGRAVGPQTLRQWCRWDSIPVPPSSTSFLWQVSTGLWQISETRPDAGALGPWAAITTGETHITALEDLRSFADPPVILRWSGPTPAVGQSFEPITISQALDLETARLVADLSAATSGALRVDIERQKSNGTWSSLFPSAPTVDLRPSLEPGESEEETFPELNALAGGSRLRLTVIELPDVAPELIELAIVGRPPEGSAAVEIQRLASAEGGGDVTGPGASEAAELWVSDGTTGRALQRSQLKATTDDSSGDLLSGSPYLMKRTAGGSMNLCGPSTATRIKVTGSAVEMVAGSSTQLVVTNEPTPTQSTDPSQTGHPSLMVRDGALFYFSPGVGWRRVDGSTF